MDAILEMYIIVMYNKEIIQKLTEARDRITKTMDSIKISVNNKNKENIAKALEKSLANINEQIYAIKNNKTITISINNQCKYMKRSCGCGRSNKDDVDKIKCTHPEVSENKAYIASRTSEKCSIPLNIPEEQGMQFCKYYEPMDG